MRLDNPTYSSNPSSQPQPSIQYSSYGPQDTPPLHGAEAVSHSIYNSISNDGCNENPTVEETDIEGYEVPIQVRSLTTPTPTTEEGYSTLQH